MDEKLSPKDWEQISEYLDGQLSGRKKDEFEKRLSRQASLKMGLQEMRVTRSILRSTPRRKLPHNFILTRAQALQTSKPGLLFPVFSFASAFSLILIFISLLIPRIPLRVPMMAAAPAAQEAFQFEIQPTAAAQAEAPNIIIWGAPSDMLPNEGMGGGGPPIPVPLMAEKEAGIPLGTPTLQMPPPEAPSAAMPEMGDSVPAPLPAEIVEKSAAPSAPPDPQGLSVAQDQMDDNGPILGVRPAEEKGMIAVTPINSLPSPPSESTATIHLWSNLRMILAVAAVLFAAAAFLVRKKARS